MKLGLNYLIIRKVSGLRMRMKKTPVLPECLLSLLEVDISSKVMRIFLAIETRHGVP